MGARVCASREGGVCTLPTTRDRVGRRACAGPGGGVDGYGAQDRVNRVYTQQSYIYPQFAGDRPFGNVGDLPSSVFPVVSRGGAGMSLSSKDCPLLGGPAGSINCHGCEQEHDCFDRDDTYDQREQRRQRIGRQIDEWVERRW